MAVVQISVLGFFLLIAPCSVRHAVQEFLNIEKTEVSNLSKSTFDENENCIVENVEISKSSSQKFIGSKLPVLPLGLISHSQPDEAIDFLTFYKVEKPNHTLQKREIPLYILYQSFRSFIG